MTRGEKRQQYFRKQKAFLKGFTGTVLVNDLLIRMGQGVVVDAEIVEKGTPLKADIEATEETVFFRKHSWADNPTLVEEFIVRCVREAKKMV